jgi:CBS domain-containing protein
VKEDPNLELDVDRSEGAPRLRIRVAYARGYSADGAAPTITDDCADHAQLAREIDRLKAELDRALERARSREPAEAAPAPEAATAARPEAAEKPRLDTDLRVADLMTRDVRTLGPNDKLVVADELMRLGRFRHAVVLDDGARLAGVLSQRDIFFSALAWSLGQGEAAHRKALEAVRVKDVMHSDVVTVTPDTPVPEAARLLSEHQIGCLPVIEEDALVGILTEGDFLTLLARR